MTAAVPHALVLHLRPAAWPLAKLVGTLWPAFYHSGRGPLRWQPHVEPPLPGPQWCRVRTRLGGICGSDLAALSLGTHPASLLSAYTSQPMGLGHENVAELVELGAEVGADPAGRPWRTGERVQVEPTLGCAARQIDPPCPACAAGRFGVCECFADPGPLGLPAGVSTGYNALTGGSWGPSFLAHRSQLVRPPEALSDEQLILTDPLACSLHAVLTHPPAAGSHVLVYGAGLIGLGVVAALRAAGPACRITVLARHPHQADAAERLGADRVLRIARHTSTADRYTQVCAALDLPAHRLRRARLGTRMFTGGFDHVFDAVGATRTVTESLRFARAGGTVVLLGTASIGVVDLTPTWFSEVALVGSYGRGTDHLAGRTWRTYELVHHLVAQGRLVTAGLLTHTVAAEAWRQALGLAARPGPSAALKVALRWPGAVASAQACS